MARIRHDVRPECLPPSLVQVEIPRHQFQQLALNIRHFVLRKHVLVHHHFRRAQIRQEHRFLSLHARLAPTDGSRNSKARPTPSFPRAVRPTR